ncbi:DUF6393 family protein [Xanthomonas medicagonis]|uniref:DUF6393 family protein n=1 Tax=Xanthomonas medicagonis TaxID=3160841 RepID=UPI00351139FF
MKIALVALTLALAVVVPACTETPRDAAVRPTAANAAVAPMLEAIYGSGQPHGFERIDVGAIVARYIPLGTPKAEILAMFAHSPSSRVVASGADTLVVRDDRGRAMLDPDPRSVVMTFHLGTDGKVAGIEAVHLKHQ